MVYSKLTNSALSDLDLQSISNMRISPRDNPFTIWSREHGSASRETCSSLARLEESYSRGGFLPTDGASFLHAGSCLSLGASRGSLGASYASLGDAGASFVSLGAAGHRLSSLSLLGSNGLLDDYNGFTPNEQSLDVLPVGQVNSLWSRRTPSDHNNHLINKTSVNPRPNYKRPYPQMGPTTMTQTDACPPTKRTNAPGTKRVLVMWTPEEDKRLEEGVAKYGVPNWIQIAEYVKTRSNKMCAQRWRNSVRSELKKVKKGKWSEDEDDKLRELVSKHDEKNGATWEQVSQSMNFTRNSKQCRERWVNFLDPNLRLGPWTAEEDAHLLRLHHQFGKRWKKFTSVLKGRSAERIRRRFTSLSKMIKRSRM